MATGGRPRSNLVWQFFDPEKQGNVVVAGVCKFCQTRYRSNVQRMTKHLLESCKKIPLNTRTDFMTQSKGSTSIPTQPPAPVDNLKRQAAAGASPSDVSDPKKQRPLFSGFDHMTPEQKEMIDQKLIQWLADCNISLNVVEKESFLAFVDALRPSYKVPCRKTVSTALLDKEYTRVKTMVEEEVAKSATLSLATDGWTDIRGTNLNNFMVYTENALYLWDYVDTAANRCTANYTFELLDQRIQVLGPAKVTGIAADNAEYIQGALRLVREKYPWISCYGCAPHGLNLLAGDLLKNDVCKGLFEKSSVLYKFFHNRKIPSYILKKISAELPGSFRELTRHVPTRWNSCQLEFETLLENQVPLQMAVLRPELTGNPAPDFKRALQQVKDIIKQDEFWEQIDSANKMLKPVSVATSLSESDSLTVAEIPRLLHKIQQELNDTVNSLAEPFQELEILQKVDYRIKFISHDVQLAANLLHPKFRGRELTAEQVTSGINYITKFVENSPSLSTHYQEILADLLLFRANSGKFDNPLASNPDCMQELNPVVWWKGCFPHASLTAVAVALLSLPPSAAATERNWSLRGAVHTKVRNRLATTKLTYVKHNNQLLSKNPKKKINHKSSRNPMQDDDIVALELEPEAPRREEETIDFDDEAGWKEDENNLDVSSNSEDENETSNQGITSQESQGLFEKFGC